MTAVLEMRVAITTENFAELVAFYRDGLDVEIAAEWPSEQGPGLMFEMGRATLEVFDPAYAAEVDALEVGARVSGPIRLALQVPDVQAALDRALAHGATLVHAPIVTPWHDINARIQAPDGMQVTLYQVTNHD